jgi:HlyD family secretion protein
MKRYIIGLPLFLLGLGACLLLWQSCKTDAANKETLKFVSAKKGDLVQKIAETGVVNILSPINIKSKLGGKIAAVYAEEGAYVDVGDKLLQLDEEDALTRLNQAKANLERSKAEIEQSNIRLEYAKSNLENCRDLYKGGLIAQYELEQAKKEHDLADIQLRVARSEGQYHQKAYSTMLKELESATIKSPISGVVLKKLVAEKEIIAPISQVLFVLGDLDQIVIKTEINEIDINKIKVGQPATIKFDAITNRSYRGQTLRIAPAGGKTRGNVVTYEVLIKMQDPDAQVKPDMSCNVDLIIERADNAVYVPIDSVKKKEGKSFVYIKSGEKTIWKEVIPGISNENDVVIMEGVKEGEEVALLPTTVLKESKPFERRAYKDFR